MQSALRANLWKLKWNSSFRNAISFGIPVVVLFWQTNGLSLSEVMILQSIFSILMVILEVPSGYFADLYGRRLSMILGSLLTFLGTLMLSVSYQFYGFLLAEILLSTGFSFVSGADSSLIFDTLNELDEKKTFKKVWGSIMSFMLAGMVIMNFIGGLVAEIELRYAFYVALPFAFISILLALSMKEPTRHKKIVKSGYLKELLQVIRQDVFCHKKLRLTIVFSAFLFAFFHISLWLYNPYFEASGLDLVWYGTIFASFSVIAAITSKYAHQIETKIGRKGAYIILFSVLGISHLLLGSFVWTFGFLFAFGHQFVRGFYQVVINDYIHNLTTSDIRATVASVNNMVARLLYAFSLPLVGWFADVYTIPQVFLMLGVLTLSVGLVMYPFLRRYKIFSD